jgi:hypothetical protein
MKARTIQVAVAARGNARACPTLQSLINQVSAQSGKALSKSKAAH